MKLVICPNRHRVCAVSLPALAQAGNLQLSTAILNFTATAGRPTTTSNVTITVKSAGLVTGIFSSDNSGRGQAAALNENGTVNSESNPSLQTGVLVFYATGKGQTRPAGQDGGIVVTGIRVPVPPVAVNVGGVPVEVLYAGPAPSQAGLTVAIQ